MSDQPTAPTASGSTLSFDLQALVTLGHAVEVIKHGVDLTTDAVEELAQDPAASDLLTRLAQETLAVCCTLRRVGSLVKTHAVHAAAA